VDRFVHADLGAVEDAVAVGVGVERVGAAGDLVAIEDAVVVGVLVVLVVAERELLLVAQAVVVRPDRRRL